MKLMISPDDYITKWYKNCKTSWKIAFISAVLIGIITHIYAMTNNLLTWDSMWNLYSDQDMLNLARPFLTYACGISSYYNLPLVNGLLGIIYLGITSVVLVEIFKIKNPILIILSSGILVTFPAIVSTISYLYTFDGYMLAVLLSALAFIITDRKKNGWISGAVLLALSIGIYQAYFSFTIVICILSLLLALIDEDEMKMIWKSIKNYMTMGILGYIIYVISVKLIQIIKHVELSGYSGANRINNIVIEDIPRGIYEAYRNFGSFAISANVLTTNIFMTIAFCAVVLLCIILYLHAFIKKGRLKQIQRIVLAVLLVMFLPLGATIVCVIFPDTFVYLSLRMPWALLFLFVLVLTERYTRDRRIVHEKAAICYQWGCIVSIFVMIFNFFLMTNIAYYNMNEKYEKSYSLCLRIVDRIEQMEEYRPWVKVAFIGGWPDSNKYPTTETTLKDLKGYYASRSDYVLDKTESYVSFIKHYLNVSLLEASSEEEYALSQNETVQNMDTFPAKNSIQMVNDVLVIKMR